MYAKSLFLLVATLIAGRHTQARSISSEANEIRSRVALKAYVMEAYNVWVSESIESFRSVLESSGAEIMAMEHKSESMKALQSKFEELLTEIAAVRSCEDEKYFVRLSLLFARILMLPVQYMLDGSEELALLNRNGLDEAAKMYRAHMEVFMKKFSAGVEEYIENLGPAERWVESDLVEAFNEYKNASETGKNQQLKAFPEFLKETNLLGKA